MAREAVIGAGIGGLATALGDRGEAVAPDIKGRLTPAPGPHHAAIAARLAAR